MPKVPRDVDPRRLIRFLEKRGWVIVRESGHTILDRGGDQVAVPHHGPLKTGTLKRILDVAKISVQEAIDEL